MAKKIKYKLDDSGLTLTHLVEGETNPSGISEGTIARIHVPFDELCDMIEDISYNNKGLTFKKEATGVIEL